MKISQRVAGLGMRQPRQAIEIIVLRSGDYAIRQGARSQLVRAVITEGGIKTRSIRQRRQTIDGVVLISSTRCGIQTQLGAI